MMTPQKEAATPELNDTLFVVNVRNEARIAISQAYTIVRTMRPLGFETDDITLCRVIIDNNLKNTKEIRDGIRHGIAKTFEEGYS